MRVFRCERCSEQLYFENTVCANCSATLAFLPETGTLSVLDAPTPGAAAERVDAQITHRHCVHRDEGGGCNWAVAIADGHAACRACRMNAMIPDLSEPSHVDYWQRLERAKRRLLYSLFHQLELDCETKVSGSPPLRFRFLASLPGAPAMTGHASGEITINVSEADPAHREAAREDLGEVYRTLLGHFRHESGHYFWERLVDGTPNLAAFRDLFGDERADYAEASRVYYGAGVQPFDQSRYISRYATMHPWEDWAETWAHYLHIVDTLETAAEYRLVVDSLAPRVASHEIDLRDFDATINAWRSVSLALNSLGRSMGVGDPYPFFPRGRVIQKLRFIHDLVRAGAVGTRPSAPPSSHGANLGARVP